MKEFCIQKFRNEYFNLSPRYNSFEELQLNPPFYDIYICGSDQIWNPYFTEKGENKITLSYFLDFGGSDIIRISYAASFGCLSYPKNLNDIIKPVLKCFNAIGVREYTGTKILEKIGFNYSKLVPDPTLLLKAEEYFKLIGNKGNNKESSIFFYTLHSNQNVINEIYNLLATKSNKKIIFTGYSAFSSMGIEGWLNSIVSSDLIVTNSFHGAIFAILFKKKVIVVPVEGALSGMNDRIYTLFKQLKMNDHIIKYFNENDLNKILKKNIDWSYVEEKIDLMRNEATNFFKKNIR